jgi:hypothetical protein
MELTRRVGRIEPALRVLAITHAARGEAWMRAGAPWNDQTGFARAALYGKAQGTDIVLGTTNDEYGPFLEMGTVRMAPRPIIQPGLAFVAPAYFKDAVRLMRGILGG